MVPETVILLGLVAKQVKRTVYEKQFEEKKAKGWSSGPAVCKKGNEDGCLVRPSSLPFFFVANERTNTQRRGEK